MREFLLDWGVMVALAVAGILFVLGAVIQAPVLYTLGCWVAALGTVFFIVWSDCNNG